MEIAKINPYIRVAIRSVLPANAEIGRRIIFDYELIYIEDGEFIFNYNEIDYPCKKGDFIFIRPNIPHRFYGIQHDLSQPHIHFDLAYAKDSPQVPVCFKDFPALTDAEKAMIREDAFAEFPHTPLISFENPSAVLAVFYSILDTPPTLALSRKANLILLIERLIADNFRDALKNRPSPYPVEKAVKEYLDAGQGTASTLEGIAKQFNYSKYYLDRKFQSQYGISIVAYRNRLRMQTAKALLAHESVSAVAEKLGFSSIYAFSRAFKTYFGYPPGATKKAK